MSNIFLSADLERFSADIFKAAGVESPIADLWAEVLVWANLRGADSHGVLRIPRYLEWLEQGAINPTPNMRIDRQIGAIAVLEADKAPGGPAMVRAMDEAIERASVHGIGWCSARNITHAGAVGYFALQAAAAGMAGLVMTASGQPLMAYHGARVSGLSTNPLAIAMPASQGETLVLDMSTSAVAYGKLLAARDQEADIPLGWGIGKDGKSTTDPKAVETLVPLGGPKGSGLSFMIECLSSVAVGNPLIAPSLSGQKSGGKFNGVAMAVNVTALGDPDQLASDIKSLSSAVAELPTADGVEEVLLPGERGRKMMLAREENGVPDPAGTWSRLAEVADALGVELPAEVRSE